MLTGGPHGHRSGVALTTSPSGRTPRQRGRGQHLRTVVSNAADALERHPDFRASLIVFAVQTAGEGEVAGRNRCATPRYDCSASNRHRVRRIRDSSLPARALRRRDRRASLPPRSDSGVTLRRVLEPSRAPAARRSLTKD